MHTTHSTPSLPIRPNTRRIFPLIAVCIALLTAAHASAQRTFTNPIAVGADPWVVFHKGHYYWCLSQSAKGVAIAKSDTLTSVGKRQTVWKAPKSGPHSHGIWAPELHLLDGRWYIYVAADNGENATHRMIVLESETDDPLSKYTFKGELYTGDNIAKNKDTVPVSRNISGSPGRFTLPQINRLVFPRAHRVVARKLEPQSRVAGMDMRAAVYRGARIAQRIHALSKNPFQHINGLQARDLWK
ncbi:family 43 glycosylhydrolase [Ereboglobus luteus]|uniref:family 43 glycosylhydrolase n=1 Tax=Ereboglobus luteus TaxID=1796921 RepID=UPI001374EA2C|nr:family 43 glycosylhydrolase [Ereboglobus luteus]